MFFQLYDKYYQKYSRIQNALRTNNKIIYRVITEYLKSAEITVMNNNFNEIKRTIIETIDRRNLINVSDIDRKELYLDIVSNILISMYNRSFNFLKDLIMNRQPCDTF